MDRKILVFAVSAYLFGVAFCRSPTTPAAEPLAAGDKALIPVAMLDLSKVYKEHARFADRSEAMRKEVQAAENVLKEERDVYAEMVKKLEGLKAGSEEHRQFSAELKKVADDLKERVKHQKEEFLRQEATIYIEIYDEIGAAIKDYARRRGIKLVLRFNGDLVDRTKHDEVLKELNKIVLYQDGLDITNDILEMVNGRG